MAREPEDDYYAVFDVATDAGEDELRRAWRRLVVRWHPDHAGPDTTAIFQQLAAAYAVLSDPLARAAYDRRRGIAPQTPEPAAPSPGRAPGVRLRRLSRSLDILLAIGVARRVDDTVIELALDDEEASAGGMVTISMRVPVRCPACPAAAACEQCGGTRTIEEPFAAWLAIRPGIADGTILTPSALLPGMLRAVSFRVRLPSDHSR